MSIHRFIQPLLVLFSLYSFQLNAQNNFGSPPETVHVAEPCTFDQLYKQSVAEDPTFLSRQASIEHNIQQWIALQGPHRSARSIITIPVVVHLIFLDSADNLSDAQVHSQIDVLNKDFRRLNSDASQTSYLFQGIAADCEIEFCLASIDTAGNPTSGITRTHTNIPLIGNSQHYYRTSSGGQNIWDRDRYLNFWVCDMHSFVNGFARPPGSAAHFDGIVVNKGIFGTIGSLSNTFNKGRTATHEVGHWLGLIHIWGQNNGCSSDDNVADTPIQVFEYYGCPSYPQWSCNSIDMHMNYMDYSNGNCKNTFTEGQKMRMLATLNTERSSLLSSNVCSSSCANFAVHFTHEYCGDSTGRITPTATLGQAPYSYQWGASAGSQTSAEINHLGPGTYAVTVTDSNHCSITDSITLSGNTTQLQATLHLHNTLDTFCNGSAAVQVTGGTLPYVYHWNGGQSTDSVSNQCAGPLFVTIRDAANCLLVLRDTLLADTITKPIGIDEWSEHHLRVFPNPSSGQIILQGLPPGELAVSVYNLQGQRLYSQPVSRQSSHRISLSEYGAGTYMLSIQANEQSLYRRVVIY